MTASLEVIDAVQQLLESDGVLQSIRAQLRASVINALSIKTSERRPSKAVEFVKKIRGQDCILCVMDLLTKLNLRETLTVFEAEIGLSNAAINTLSSRDDLSEKLRIMSSIDDVYEPILYQLLEATVSASVGKDKSTRTTVELPSQRVPQIANIPKDQQVAASPPSPEKSKPRAFEKSSKEPEYKQQEVRSLNKNTDFSIPMSDIDQESNDDSFADDKSSEINSIERDSKQMRDEKKKGVSSPKGLFNDDHESDDGKSYDDPEGDDDDIEIGAGSESSASFSLEYGYVEDTKPTDSNGKPKEIADEKKSSGSDVKNRAGSDEKNSASSDSKQSISNGVEKSKPLTTLSVSRLASPDLAPSPKVELESVGLQKLGHGMVNRSKLGWNIDQNDHEDDFQFSEEPDTCNNNQKLQSRNSKNAKEGTNVNGGASRAGNGKDESIQETVLAKSVQSKDTAASIPAARSSWGAASVAVEVAKKDDESQSDADCMAEDDMSVGQSDSDSDDQDMFKSSFKDKQSLNTTETSTKKENSGGSLFMSRSQSGALPSVVSITSNKKQRAVDSIIGFDDDEDESAEFDADADYSKDEGTYMSSHSDKLSEVERKLAEMERENNDFVELRLKDESKGKVVNKNMDISAVSNGDGDYSEEDFESGSDNEIEIGDESVASEDIDAMELSVGGAGSDSDGSFNGLNSEISKKKSTPVPNKDVGNWGSKAALTKNVITQKSTILKEDSDGSEFSHSGSDSADMEFSTNDIEMSSSRGIESDAGYDFTAKPIAVVTTRGPRDRTSGW